MENVASYVGRHAVQNCSSNLLTQLFFGILEGIDGCNSCHCESHGRWLRDCRWPSQVNAELHLVRYDTVELTFKMTKVGTS